MTKRRRAMPYARSAIGEGEALAWQLEACRELAQAHGYTVTGEYSEVGNGRAATLPEKAQAIAQAESGGAALICFDLARLSRDSGRLAELMAECQRRGVKVHFVEG